MGWQCEAEEDGRQPEGKVDKIVRTNHPRQLDNPFLGQLTEQIDDKEDGTPTGQVKEKNSEASWPRTQGWREGGKTPPGL
jgi:hypothetical protein